MVTMGTFPGWEGFILGVRKAHFYPKRPLFFNLADKSVKLSHTRIAPWTSVERVTGRRQSGLPKNGGRERHIPGDTLLIPWWVGR